MNAVKSSSALGLLLCFVTMLSPSVWAGESVAELLNQYAWEKRQLIVYAPSAEHEQLAVFNRVEKEFSEAFEERRLHTWRVIADQPVTLDGKVMGAANGAHFKDHFQFKDAEFALVLVGYDQGEKLRQTEVDIDYLFAEIDQMPMRQMEMGI